VRLWQDLASISLNLFYSERGHYTLGIRIRPCAPMRWGPRSTSTTVAFRMRSMPLVKPVFRRSIDLRGHAPDPRALFTTPGAIARHDAVPGGMDAAPIRRRGDSSANEVTGIRVQGGRVVGSTPLAAHRHVEGIVAVAGLRANSRHGGPAHPIYVHPLQAMVSEPVKPWLDPIIVSGSLHVYVSQTARGELVMGASLDPYELHATRPTLDFVRGSGLAHAGHVPVSLATGSK